MIGLTILIPRMNESGVMSIWQLYEFKALSPVIG